MENVQSNDQKNNTPDWMFEIDGCKKDIRKEPREFQEQACYSGMIPFIPADYPKNGKIKEEFENNIRIVEIPSGKSKSIKSEPILE